jgi:hypothetical protein
LAITPSVSFNRVPVIRKIELTKINCSLERALRGAFAAALEPDWAFARQSRPAHQRLSALARRLNFQSPRAICAALTMQRSLGGNPHRADRSQSSQIKLDRRRSAAIVLASLLKTPWTALVARMFFSFACWSHRSGGAQLH